MTEVLQAHLAQIERVNPKVNAIVTLRADEALAEARAADARLPAARRGGPLTGCPSRTRISSPPEASAPPGARPSTGTTCPTHDALIVERIKAAGAITVGKTNTPEFGAGSQTFNAVFGATLNPYDPTKTCGGSERRRRGRARLGACVPIADGSDMGGSLRNPASFCNVVGFRPSPGRVPDVAERLGWAPFSVDGPMARTVAGRGAAALGAWPGPIRARPIAIDEPGARFRGPLDRELQRRAGRVEPGPRRPARRPARDGRRRRPAGDVSGARLRRRGRPAGFLATRDEIFQALRGMAVRVALRRRCSSAIAHQLKDTIIWNIEQGQKLTGPQVAAAERKRTALYHRVREFMRAHEFLVLPVTQVPPFDVHDAVRRPRSTACTLATYIDWMRACSDITVTGLPAISVPCGFTADGLPVGVQIVGRHHDDWGVLQLAYAFEQATSFWKRRPPLAT